MGKAGRLSQNESGYKLRERPRKVRREGKDKKRGLTKGLAGRNEGREESLGQKDLAKS